MITNPVLKYYGGKFRLAKWIISHFPQHEHYVEPFGGGGSILFQKPESRVETYNDLDGDVVNFFRVVRDRPDDLVRAITLTPWARDEFERCVSNYIEDCKENLAARLSYPDVDLENARRLYVRLWMSRHAGTIGTLSSWRRNMSKRSPASDIRPRVIYDAAERLRKVQIENRDALKLIGEMDSGKTLFYLDPPYVTETRTNKKRYAHELTDAGHAAIAAAAKAVKGFVVLSGYACDLYKKLYQDAGWKRIDIETVANGGVKRTESLWLNPRTITALADRSWDGVSDPALMSNALQTK
ncbi:MAG TPA: DNA adenine methylase [Pyrinomonadaceae bacterium]|jgi:DNA adenine methylase|nr:DNA adenine methylase [Pyrinomonadaceae bacterium]